MKPANRAAKEADLAVDFGLPTVTILHDPAAETHAILLFLEQLLTIKQSTLTDRRSTHAAVSAFSVAEKYFHRKSLSLQSYKHA